MADTQRTVAATLALLADNSAGAISPQDIRDFAVSWRPAWGVLSVAAADSGAITISNSNDYFEATAMAWTLGEARLFDENSNGRLRYIGTEPVTAFVTATVSITSGSGSQVTHWRIGDTGTTLASSEVQRKIGVGADVGALAVTGLAVLDTNDYVSLWCRNSSGSNDVTIEVATMQVSTAIR